MDKVIAFNIPADKMCRSSEFYQEVFGWEIREVPGSSDYLRAETVESDEDGPKERGAINGGIFKRGIHGIPVPFIEVLVHSIDNTVELATIRGGRLVLERKRIGTSSDFAIIQDCDGNYIGLWEDV